MFKEYTILQMPHPMLFTKLAMDQIEAPGAKVLRICPWWACFKADQGQKLGKTAHGHILQSRDYPD
jgi:hypothetical protein